MESKNPTTVLTESIKSQEQNALVNPNISPTKDKFKDAKSLTSKNKFEPKLNAKKSPEEKLVFNDKSKESKAGILKQTKEDQVQFEVSDLEKPKNELKKMTETPPEEEENQQRHQEKTPSQNKMEVELSEKKSPDENALIMPDISLTENKFKTALSISSKNKQVSKLNEKKKTPQDNLVNHYQPKKPNTVQFLNNAKKLNNKQSKEDKVQFENSKLRKPRTAHKSIKKTANEGKNILSSKFKLTDSEIRIMQQGNTNGPLTRNSMYWKSVKKEIKTFYAVKKKKATEQKSRKASQKQLSASLKQLSGCKRRISKECWEISSIKKQEKSPKNVK